MKRALVIASAVAAAAAAALAVATSGADPRLAQIAEMERTGALSQCHAEAARASVRGASTEDVDRMISECR